MRPIKLEMTGFAAFREQTVIDFDGHELLAFTGPTGAGKSTIIDGIAFALFGSVARYGNEKLIAPIINTLSTEARVRLDFSLGDERYTVVRVIRRTQTGGASTKEARLEKGPRRGHTDEPDAEDSTVLAGTAAEVTSMVESLLGLSFGQFTKTVVLPQGDFARFLTETAGDRQSLLRRLLGLDVYAAMGATARRRSKEARIEADATRSALGTTQIVTDGALARLTKAADKIDAATAEALEIHEQLTEATSTRDTTVESLAQLDESLMLVTAVQIPDDAAAYASDVEAADKAVAAAEKKNERALTKLATAQDALDQLESADTIGEQISLRDRSDALKQTCSSLDTTATAAAEELASAEQMVTSIEDRLEQAREELKHTRIAAGAAGIAATLSVGDDCPVCAQVIDVLPEVHDHDVSTLESLVAQAEDAARQARTAAQEASTNATTAAVAASNERDALVAVTKELADVPSRSALTAMAKKIATITTKLETAMASADVTAQEVADATAARTALDDRVSELSRDFVESRDRLSALDPPLPNGDDLVENWRALADWSSEQVTTLTGDRKELTARAASDEKAVTSLEKQLARHAKAFDLDPELRAEDVYGAMALQRDAAVALRDDAAFRKQRDATNAARITELDDVAVVSAELGKLLNAKGFEQWLMADVMIDLAERATERLRVLSSGSYSLTTDGTDFAVLDHRNADEVRSARTLSGGETFLASLALALALADSITEMASTAIPPTESVFLDEGFGTLDGETLDVVASAIEELGAAGRLVCIVTHITELADRLPQHVRVTRSPNGSSVDQGDPVLGAST